MSKISAIIIAKDEEERIVDCIKSISFCEEIIVVDGGSCDQTAVLAKKNGAKVFMHQTRDFSDSRNFGLSKASEEWVLYIDADERVAPELVSSIKNKVFSIDKNSLSAYKIRRKNFYLGNYEWPQVEKLERLFKKSKLKGWFGELHESPLVEGSVGELEGFLLHYTHRNPTEMLKKTIAWSSVEADLRLKANHPKMTWWRFPRVMMSAFVDYYIFQRGWKLGTAGLIESIYQSFSIFITYARLWELQQDEKIKGQKSL